MIDREASLLAFNRRVLAQARRPDVPLLERLRYVTIVSSNLDEFFEVLTLAQIGYHGKRSVLFDQEGYWQPLLAAVHAMVGYGFVREADLASLRVADSPAAALAALAP